MSARVTINFESANISDTKDLEISDELLTATAIRNAMPSWDKLNTVVRDQPDATARLLQDYSAGRTDLALASARNLGLVTTRTAVGAESETEAEGVLAVIILIVVAIILILLFPKPVS
jgi:hypothetical protein